MTQYEEILNSITDNDIRPLQIAKKFYRLCLYDGWYKPVFSKSVILLTQYLYTKT